MPLGVRRRRRDIPTSLAHSVHDLNQNPLAVLDAARLHHGPERLRGAPFAADHLAPVGLGDQRAGEKLEQVFQAIPFAFRSFLTVSLGSAPFLSQVRTRSSSSSIVEGSVWGL